MGIAFHYYLLYKCFCWEYDTYYNPVTVIDVVIDISTCIAIL